MPAKQKDIFLESEGDAWFDRNHASLGLYDPVTSIIEELMLKPKSVLEVGCANGWRLAKLREKFGCKVLGIDPSRKAAMDGARFRVPIHQMTASTLPCCFPDSVDLIIYGFCLYLADPEDWLTIAAEADRALATEGHIIIHDFGDWAGGSPMAKDYSHQPFIRSYHYGFEKLWLGHPRYQVVKVVDGAHNDSVTVLSKNSIRSVRVTT